MKKLVVLLILPLNALVQNLVPNPSFEEFISCPSSSTDFGKCISWINPTQAGTPDYYAVCSNTVPQHGIYGYQYPSQGENFVGIYLFKNEQLGQNLENIREYIQIKLSSNLIAQNCYLLTMFINLNNQSYFGSNNMGCNFSQNQIYLNSQNSYLVQLNPQINFKTIIKDTLNWKKVSGIFFSQGGEEYLTIGNFFHDSLTKIEIFNANDNFQMKSAYYYIDDISVIPIDSLPNNMPAYAGENVLVNPGDSIFIGQEISNLNCTWRNLDGTILATNTSGIYVQPTETTTYVVEQNLCGNVTFDTVVVSVGYLGINESSPLPPSKEGRVKISPNPNNGTFTLKTYSLEIKELKLIDEIGRQLQNLDPKSNVFNLNLPKGVYFLEINCEGHQVIEKMVIN